MSFISILHIQQRPSPRPSTSPPTTSSPTTSPPTTLTPTSSSPTPLQYCPPSYDTAKTDYTTGELIESELYIFQCAIGPPNNINLYEEYCNMATLDTSLSQYEKQLWDTAWIPISECYRTLTPTTSPTYKPSNSPTEVHSSMPSIANSNEPSLASSQKPSIAMSERPSIRESDSPSAYPSGFPTETPTFQPTFVSHIFCIFIYMHLSNLMTHDIPQTYINSTPQYHLATTHQINQLHFHIVLQHMIQTKQTI